MDWASFGFASLLAFAVYLFTLSPSADLRFSGIFSTSALYLGVSNPPAYPVWTIYSWLFAHLLPVSNIAWRVAVANAVASAVACGLVAMLVSRVGTLTVENLPNFKNLSAMEEKSLRIVCGTVVGLGFGLDGCFWRRAVVPDQWNFHVCFLALALCLLTRWFFAPQQKRYLYAFFLLLGLMVSDNQALFPAAFALTFLLPLGDAKVGREIFFSISVFLCAVLATNGHFQWLGDSTRDYSIGATVVVALAWIGLAIKTRQFFSEWKTMSLCIVFFLAGLAACLLLPIFSMMNPPMNWGYPRTVEGFFHVISRGQYEAMQPTTSLHAMLTEWQIYGKIAVNEFGVMYLAAALMPFCLLHKIPLRARKWMVGLLAIWFTTTALMLVGLAPTPERSSIDAIAPFFSATHLMLAIISGCGLMLIGVLFARPSPRP